MAKAAKRVPNAAPRLHRLRIELEGITPLIWRRVWIGGEVTLAKLHHVIQAAMGWTDAHQHEFQIGGGSYGTPETDPDFAPIRPVIDEQLVRVESVLQGISSFRYWYDFGDDWWHLVTVEETRPIDEDENPPIFGYVEAGENACPPEDSGGIPGYQGFLDAWARGKKDEEVREFLDWAGEDFDPARFDRRAANAALERMAWNRWV
jgi:hypothetical protein